MDVTFGDPFNTTAGTDQAQGEQKSEGVVPVFIAQILRAADDHYRMWGMTFNMVTIVGIVRNMETSSTKITYKLEDHTGQIEAHYWLEEDNPSKTPNVMMNCYARVYGAIRQHGDTKTIMIFKMLPLSGINELSTHLMEVYTARYKAEKYSQRMDTMPAEQERNDTAHTSGLSANQSAVLQAIQNYMDSESGISRQELLKKFTNIPRTDMGEILDFLVNEGIIYTSIDCEHFLST